MRVESDIESFRATESGQELLKQFDDSGHEVTIKETNDLNGYAHGSGSEIWVKEDGQRGKGSDGTISYNTSYNGPEEGVPLNVLFHEGVHSYNYVTGTLQPGEQEREGRSDVNKREQQAVGLEIEDGIEVEHPDGTVSASNPELLTENAIRAELGLKEREVY